MAYMESGFQWTKCLKQSPCLSTEVTLAYGSISSLLLISKAHYFVSCLAARQASGPARARPFARAVIYFREFLRYCFVRANHREVINDAEDLHSPLVARAAKLIFKSFTSIIPVLELCKGTKEQGLQDMSDSKQMR